MSSVCLGSMNWSYDWDDTPDLVVVVRCRDCRYGRASLDGENVVCHGEVHPRNWYCASGKEKPNEEATKN